MNNERHLWQTLLDVEAPWTVTDCKENGGRRHDIWIGLETPRPWLGIVRARPVPGTRTLSWRHANFGAWQIHIHVQAPGTADLSRQPWAGEPDLPFTRALNERIFTFLREGCSLQSICTLLDLPITELWRLRYAMDSGRWGFDRSPAKCIAAHGSETDAGAAADPDVPDVADPVWVALLEGGRQLDIRVLGLKLLLTRLRAQFEMISDVEVRTLKLQELHRYFLKNKRLLAHELSQIRSE
ncbi:hypothetical protein [Thauera mechernichensis]